MSERELIEGIIRRDREAVKLLVDLYQEQVIRTAFHFLGNMEDAEDLSQEIFLDVIGSIHRFRMDSKLSTWIYRIVVNRSLNEVNKKKRRERLHMIGNYFQPGGREKTTGKSWHSDPGYPDEQENRELLKKAVDSLPLRQKTVFVLSKYDDRSHKEISEITGLSISAIESLIFRAKQKLQKMLAVHFSEYVKE